MFTTINKWAGVRSSQVQRLRESAFASVSGIALTAVAFQAIYFVIFALE